MHQINKNNQLSTTMPLLPQKRTQINTSTQTHRLSADEWLHLWRDSLTGIEGEENLFARRILSFLVRLYSKRNCALDEIMDLAQSCIEKLYKSDRRILRQFDPSRGSFPTYLRVVAITNHLDYIKSLAKRKQASEINICSVKNVADTNRSDDRLNANELLRLIHNMKPQEDKICILLHIEGLLDKEISIALGIPMGTVATRIRRARKQMIRSGVFENCFTNNDQYPPGVR